MKFTFFTHSLVSDWNHGNAHFLRGVMRALQARGPRVPRAGAGRRLVAQQSVGGTRRRRRSRPSAAIFPDLRSDTYGGFDEVIDVLDDSDVVVVHEWTDPAPRRRPSAGRGRGAARFMLLFHDTHHRAVSRRRRDPRAGPLGL